MNSCSLTLFVCLFLISINRQAQFNSILVCDSLSKEPIAFATFNSDSSGFYSDVLGFIPRELLSENEYQVSCIGYYPKQIISALVRDTIFLLPSVVQVKEVVIKAEYEPFEIGYHELTSNMEFTMRELNYILVAHIPFEGQRNARIEEVIIPLKKLRKGDKFKLLLFKVSEDGSPGDLIFSRKIISETGRNDFRLNLDKELIELPESGLFAGITWVKSNNANDRIPRATSTTDSDSNRTYVFVKNKWSLLEILPGENWNLRIGLKVRPY